MLRICVLGNNKHHSEQMLKYICENDNDSKPIKILRDRVIMNDDTEYYALSNNYNEIRGRYIDQLIIANNDLRFTKAFEYAEYRMFMSCVPEEFLVQVIDV